MAQIVIDAALGGELIRVTEEAAIAAFGLAGRGNERMADQAAVDAMRKALNAVGMKGRIVIGEGERDEAPMLYIGEEVGTGKGPEIDIALDPLEGTTLTAKGLGNALAVLAIAPRGTMLHSPDVYMEKLAIGPGYPEGIVSLENTAAENIEALAKAKGSAVKDITVCVLDRPRHHAMIDALRDVGVRIVLIPDGDIAGVINTTDKATGIDMYMGQGGAPEGVLAAAALKCIGGQMQGRLAPTNDEETARAAKMGIPDINRKFQLEDMASNDVIFSATGITDGSLLDGVRFRGDFAETETVVMRSKSGTVRRVKTTFRNVGTRYIG